MSRLCNVVFQALVRKEDHEANWTQLFFGADDLNPSTIQTLDPSDPSDGLTRPEESIDSIDFTSEVPDQVSFIFFMKNLFLVLLKA